MFELLTQSFFLNSLISLLIISLATGALGSFMVWQRLSYLGDSLSHSSLLGIALALIFNVNTSVTITTIAIAFAILLAINFDKLYSRDATLNIITNVVLSISLILMSFLSSTSSNIIHSLFGDILMLSSMDIITILTISILVIVALILRWHKWLIITVSQDLARAEGINVSWVRLEFLIILSIFIAVAAQLIGILLITAFLLIPAAAARLVTKTPIQMIIIATIISTVAAVSGLLFSVQFDIPTGPTIILTSFLYFILLYLFKIIKE
ncbi:metal ABC transporter permease [Candidatus Mesenet endosymbiont of Agriotes lineatus]|uniref:metal ABC transporter permease n=1 Tax=Candidatus Mesenet endosymbiont of Agriotes lineatus TaxID=3077948 RepID=UPI0030CA74F2